jgi:hypothetical protein
LKVKRIGVFPARPMCMCRCRCVQRTWSTSAPGPLTLRSNEHFWSRLQTGGKTTLAESLGGRRPVASPARRPAGRRWPAGAHQYVSCHMCGCVPCRPQRKTRRKTNRVSHSPRLTSWVQKKCAPWALKTINEIKQSGSRMI